MSNSIPLSESHCTWVEPFFLEFGKTFCGHLEFFRERKFYRGGEWYARGRIGERLGRRKSHFPPPSHFCPLLPFDQKFRREFPEISMGEWHRLFQWVKRQAAQCYSRGNDFEVKIAGKPNTLMSTSWLFTDHNSKDHSLWMTRIRSQQAWHELLSISKAWAKVLQSKQVLSFLHHRMLKKEIANKFPVSLLSLRIIF